MLSNMESNAQAELAEVQRLSDAARRASYEVPGWVHHAVMAAQLTFFGVLVATHARLPLAVVAAWWAAGIVLYAYIRGRRRALPRRRFSTREGRQDLVSYVAMVIAINAVWLPLWAWREDVALAVLGTVIVLSWLRELRSNLRRGRA